MNPRRGPVPGPTVSAASTGRRGGRGRPRTSPRPRPAGAGGASSGTARRYALYSLRSWRARVILCTSVAPSARPMWNDSSTIAAERHLVGHAERAVHLQRPGGDVVQHLRHRHLHRRDVVAHLLVVVVLVDLPRGAQHEQAELLDLDPGVGDHLLHQLLAGQQLALGGPRQRPLAHHVEGPPAPARWCAWRGGCDRRRGGSARPRSPGPARRAGGRPGTRTFS